MPLMSAANAVSDVQSLFHATCSKLLERMKSAPVLLAKKYGRGELDAVHSFSAAVTSKLPDALKQEVYAAARRWHIHQIYKTERNRKFLPQPDHLAPSLDGEGAGQT